MLKIDGKTDRAVSVACKMIPINMIPKTIQALKLFLQKYDMTLHSVQSPTSRHQIVLNNFQINM